MLVGLIFEIDLDIGSLGKMVILDVISSCGGLLLKPMLLLVRMSFMMIRSVNAFLLFGMVDRFVLPDVIDVFLMALIMFLLRMLLVWVTVLYSDF